MVEDSGIQWNVDTHEHIERSNDWYWGLGLGTLAAAGLSIFLGNALLAIILLLGAGSLGILMARGPREHEVRVNPKGLALDGTMYRWAAIDSFWVEEGRDAQLLVTTKGVIHPQLIVPLGDQTRAQNIRAYMRRFCKEEEQDPHLGHHIAQLLGL